MTNTCAHVLHKCNGISLMFFYGFFLQAESIAKDLRALFTACIKFGPSILIMDNLDVLAQTIAEQTADGEYYNRLVQNS